ncbi:MAG: hypothetical protein R3F33_06850 [Planctomycetota bacterium]
MLRDLLEARETRSGPAAGQRLAPLALWVCLAGLVYGICMGSWQWRPLQMLYSGIKTPLLISAGGLFVVPFFLVLHLLLGLREDFGRALRSVLRSQVVVAISLASLGPLQLVWYTAIDNYSQAKACNGMNFLLASLAGQWTLARLYRPLIARDPRHRLTLAAWLSAYWFVSIQLAWILRPFIGRPGETTQFFRDEAWGNAYVEAWRALLGSF